MFKKNIIVLDVLNSILQNVNKNKINSLEEFKDIKRSDIVKDINKNMIETKYDYIFTEFKKVSCQYYQKHKIKDYILTLIKEMCRDIGYVLKSHYKKDCVEIDGEIFTKNTNYYFIEKKEGIV